MRIIKWLYITVNVIFNNFILTNGNLFMDTQEPSSANLISNEIYSLIETYSGYSVTIHYDSCNDELVNSLANLVNCSGLLLLNYDFPMVPLGEYLVHARTVHVVLMENVQQFIDMKLYNIQDIAIFVLSNDQFKFTILNFTKEAGFENTFVIMVDNQIVLVEKICYYCGSLSDKFTSLTPGSLRAKSFTNLDRNVLKVSFINYYPVVSCQKYGQDVEVNSKQHQLCTEVGGIERKLVDTIGDMLNFNFISVLREKDYMELINRTGEGFYDIGMGGISITPERLQWADFTIIYRYESYNCLFFTNNFSWLEIFGFLKPLSHVLWISLLSSSLLISIGIYFVKKCTTRRTSAFSIIQSFWTLMHLFVDQQAPVTKLRKIRNRSFVMIIAWYLVGLNLNIAYKSKVLSTLMNPRHSEPQTLINLIENNFKVVINSFYDDVATTLLESNKLNAKLSYVLSNPIKFDTVCKEFNYAANHRAAVLDEYTSLQYETRRTCLAEMQKSKNKLPNLMITRPMHHVGHGLVLKKNSPFKKQIDKAILKISSSGLLLKWTKDATSDMDSLGSFIPYSFQPLGEAPTVISLRLRSLISPFFVYIVGHFIAIIVFIFEYLYKSPRIITVKKNKNK